MLIWATWGYLRWGPQEKALFCRTGSAPVTQPVPLHPHARHEPAAAPPPPRNQCYRHKLASPLPLIDGRRWLRHVGLTAVIEWPWTRGSQPQLASADGGGVPRAWTFTEPSSRAMAMSSSLDV